MRYDTPVYFQTVTHGAYDAGTGNYAADAVTEVKQYADVQSASIDMLKIVYGDIRQGSKTISLQNAYTDPFDRIRIGSRLYRVDYSRQLHVKQVFVVSEVQ